MGTAVDLGCDTRVREEQNRLCQAGLAAGGTPWVPGTALGAGDAGTALTAERMGLSPLLSPCPSPLVQHHRGTGGETEAAGPGLAGSPGTVPAPLEATEGNGSNHLPITAMALISSWQGSHPR